MKERDGYALLVPADWDVPGAVPINATPNEGFAEGLLVGTSASVAALVAAGVDLPGPVFLAHGTSDEGVRSGVVIGVYDPDVGGSLDQLSEALAKAAPPGAEVRRLVVAEADAVRLDWPPPEASGGTPSGMFDLWVPVPEASHLFVVARFWREGSGNSDGAAQRLEYISGTFYLIAPTFFRGVSGRVAPALYGPPPTGEVQEGWRVAGSRLASVFHTKVVPPSRLGAYSQGGSRKRDRAVLLAEFVVWLGLVIGLVGFETPLVLAGTGSYLGATAIADSTLKAPIGLGAVFVALLVVGLAAY